MSICWGFLRVFCFSDVTRIQTQSLAPLLAEGRLPLWGIVFSSDGPRASPARHCCPSSCIYPTRKPIEFFEHHQSDNRTPRTYSLSLSLALASEREKEKEMLIKQKRLEGEVIDIQVMPVVSRQPPNNNNRRAG